MLKNKPFLVGLYVSLLLYIGFGWAFVIDIADTSGPSIAKQVLFWAPLWPVCFGIAWLCSWSWPRIHRGRKAAGRPLIDPPASRRELFWRLAAAGMCSMFFGEIAMDFLHSLSWFAFLDPLKHSHQAGVNFLVGGSGWFVLGRVGVLLKRFKGDPTGTIAEARKDLTP